MVWNLYRIGFPFIEVKLIQRIFNLYNIWNQLRIKCGKQKIISIFIKWFFFFYNKNLNMIKICSIINRINYLFTPSFNIAFFSYNSFNTSSKQKITINNNIAYNLEAINWFSLNNNGFIIPLITNNIEKKPAIYIYINIY